jgi:ABC-type branched-subunit amino acid transport system ATPase component
MTAPAMLEVRAVSRRFGGVLAVDALSFDVPAGSVVGLIGPNGSGKTTVFNLITNVLAKHGGSVRLDGRPIDRTALWRLAHAGLGRTFQEAKIFREISVWRNMSIAAAGHRRAHWREAARHWLEVVELGHLRDDLAETLSIGQQRLLEIAMNLFVEPKLLLLDEPLAGVNPIVRDRIAAIIRERRAAGRTFLIIEHDMRFVMDICDWLIVMRQGRCLASGTPPEIKNNPEVIDALLGRQLARG